MAESKTGARVEDLGEDLNYTTEKSAIVQIEEQRAIQEVQAQVILANRFPRNIETSRSKILAECKRPLFAEKAMYQYPRGETTVIGPSIRMAEMMARNWKNLAFGIKEIGQREGFSDLRSFAWDMENNVYEERTFTVPHVRYSKKKGNVRLTDPREIYENNANQGARRMRACILAHIPIDVMEEAIDEVNKTLVNSLIGDKGKDRLKKMLELFSQVKVTQKMIESKFNTKLKSLTSENIAELVRIYNSLRDGIGKPKDYFETAKEEQSQDAKDIQKALTKTNAQNKTTETEPDQPDEKETEHVSEQAEKENAAEVKLEPENDESKFHVDLETDTWKEANVPEREAEKWLDDLREDMFKIFPCKVNEVDNIRSVGDFIRAWGIHEYTTIEITPRIYKAMRDFINKTIASEL